VSTDHENGAPRIVDNRGKNKNPVPPVQESQFTDEQLEALREQAAADDSTPIQNPDFKPVLTAFLVVLGHDGTVSATGDIGLINDLQLSREAVLPDMYSAAAHIMKDVNQQETTIRVLEGLRQQANAAREQMMAERVQQQMAGHQQPRVQVRR
jgi:hypothetical protein